MLKVSKLLLGFLFILVLGLGFVGCVSGISVKFGGSSMDSSKIIMVVFYFNELVKSFVGFCMVIK